jgi:hypothetical protein
MSGTGLTIWAIYFTFIADINIPFFVVDDDPMMLRSPPSTARPVR